MQFSADLVALQTHHADVHRSERELAVRRSIEERRSGDVTSPEAAPSRNRGHHFVVRLALR
ncbi:hypothetical protein J7E25_01985 [Agromyces sp. ISL-38]|uniref:hypothetical protein n=1 Tax=Agromyces sp. ISL-38 TaxID=2819107 RepID=UPI001BEBD1F5|nr:hypothetical protein [Agromyces sp. ISL-38]MBT2497857.1 hypothetical protein [Agromyces sp. ISL-38]MBT2517055.1 hypothetical protein [Streptomyces sp. ISL-90]